VCTFVQFFLFGLLYTLHTLAASLAIVLGRAFSWGSSTQDQLFLSSSLPQTPNNLSFRPTDAKVNFSFSRIKKLQEIIHALSKYEEQLIEIVLIHKKSNIYAHPYMYSLHFFLLE
jgi:hypothetical protein